MIALTGENEKLKKKTYADRVLKQNKRIRRERGLLMLMIVTTVE